MTRKPRATPRTVSRWLSEGIAPRTFERLVDTLAPSKATAARWRRDGIPEKTLRAIKPPAPQVAPRPATVARWIDEGIPARSFERAVRTLAPTPRVADRWRREEAIPVRALAPLAPRPKRPKTPPKPAPKPRRAAVVSRWLEEGIPERTFETLVSELAPSKATAQRWRRAGEIPAARLEAIAFQPKPRPKRPKRPKAPREPVPTLEVQPEPRAPEPEVLSPEAYREALEQREAEEQHEEAAREAALLEEEEAELPPEALHTLLEHERAAREALEAELARRDEASERAAIEAEGTRYDEEEEEDEDEKVLAPEDCYPLPTKNLEFFKSHDRTDLEGITKIHYDPETGRILGTDDKGRAVAAYLFTNEDGQPKQGPDSLRWALARDLGEYVAEVNRVLRERYGDSTMRGAFGCFSLPERKAA